MNNFNLKNFLWGVFLGVVLFWLLIYRPGATRRGRVESSDTVEVVTTEIKWDTIEKIVHDTIWKEVPVEVPVYVQAPIEEGKDSLRTYEGEVLIEQDLVAMYKVDVSGWLEGINIGITDSRPELVKTITETKEITVTNTISPRGLYLGASSNFENVYFDVAYMKGRSMFGFGYDPFRKQAMASYRFRIF